jgi:hypothetical protein
VRKRSMLLRGFGGALSISSWGISAAILSIAAQCQPSLETWVPCRCFYPSCRTCSAGLSSRSPT